MENFFETFNGADLDRLVSCIQAVRSEGLQLDKYSQAGVNQSSGNVYIWSEDWPGCVYCTIGGSVQWSYSCPDCGEEYDFNTYSEMESYAAKHDGQCEACATIEMPE